MTTMLTSLLSLAGRVLLCALFVIAGFGKLMAPGATIGYIASVGLPAPGVGYVLALVVELGGGLLLLAGFFTRWVAAALALFCVFTALEFHGFADMNNQIHAMKNFAIAGGLLYVVAFGAGGLSLDGLRARRAGG